MSADENALKDTRVKAGDGRQRKEFKIKLKMNVRMCLGETEDNLKSRRWQGYERKSKMNEAEHGQAKWKEIFKWIQM